MAATSFKDLSECYKLMVTDYLPLEDKMAWIDVFPPVIDQIDIFDMNRDIHGDIDGQVKLFNKLFNVKIIKLTKTEAFKPFRFPLLDIPEFVPNPGVGCFVDSNGDIMESWMFWDIVPYVKRVLETHPDYDGSCIKNYFEVVDERVIEMVQQNRGLKIKLVMGRRAALKSSHLFQEERIKRMIGAFSGVSDEFIVSLPGGMIFESVTRVDIDERPFADAKIEFLEQFLLRTPNMTWLSLRLIFDPDVNVNSVIRFISSIKNLEHLELKVPYSSVHFKCLLEFLLTSRQLPKLKHLTIDHGFDMRDSWIVSALELDIKPGFRQLTMEHECLVGVARPPKAKFMVGKRAMTIQNIEPRLVDTFNKFSRVKYIDVVTRARSTGDSVKWTWRPSGTIYLVIGQLP